MTSTVVRAYRVSPETGRMEQVYQSQIFHTTAIEVGGVGGFGTVLFSGTGEPLVVPEGHVVRIEIQHMGEEA